MQEDVRDVVSILGLGRSPGGIWGFPHSSIDKESACNAVDLDSIPGSGRSTGEGIDYPLQYSWASLVAQVVKNLPAMRETLVQSLGWEDTLGLERPPGEGKGYPLQYSGLENPMDDYILYIYM